MVRCGKTRLILLKLERSFSNWVEFLLTDFHYYKVTCRGKLAVWACIADPSRGLTDSDSWLCSFFTVAVGASFELKQQSTPKCCKTVLKVLKWCYALPSFTTGTTTTYYFCSKWPKSEIMKLHLLKSYSHSPKMHHCTHVLTPQDLFFLFVCFACFSLHIPYIQ